MCKPSPSSVQTRALLLCSMLAAAAMLGACRQDMHDQLKLEPLEQSLFFADGRASRQPVEGTIARGQLKADRHLYEGRRPADDATASEQERRDGELVDSFPFAVTRDVLLRGKERYDIHCSPCHARTGDGDGMVVRRGYRRPPSLHDEKLRQAKAGHLYDVIRNGFGVMPSYPQIAVADRWAIVAYIRALQLSRHASLKDAPPEVQKKLQEEMP